ncbi:MAG: hypothetical protein ACOCVF_01515 [bacterium]
MADLTKTEIKNIVKDEIKTYLERQLEKEVKSLLKKKDAKETMTEIVRNALVQLYKYMWIRKDVWSKDIKS